MKNMIVVSLLLASSLAQADIIKCRFTEPFIVSEYSTSQSTLTYESFEYKKTVIKNVSFQIKSAGVFELVGQDGKVIQTLTLNNEGSDGMSDSVYPYEVKDNSQTTAANSGIGGCYSNYLKIKEVGQ